MKLAIIVGSTRPGRQTPKQAKWVAGAAKKISGVEAEVVDLADYPMSLFNEPISPRYNPDRKIDPKVQQWLSKLDSADAYIFVTPEYNHSIPGVLKNALDYVTWELQRKPATIVSHGSAGGARAAMHLREILSESQAAIVPQPNSLAMVGMSDKLDEHGKLDAEIAASPYSPQKALEDLLANLQWYSDALGAARTAV